MKKYVLLGLLFGAVLSVALFASQVLAFGDRHHNVWETVKTGSWSDCKPDEGTTECKGGNGTKTRILSQECKRTEGEGKDECKIEWVKPVYDCDLKQTVHGESFDVSQFYNKNTGDDNHCHRIKWGDLTSDQQNDFKKIHHYDEDYGSPNHPDWKPAYESHIIQNPDAHLVSEGYWKPETREVEEKESCEIPADPKACEVREFKEVDIYEQCDGTTDITIHTKGTNRNWRIGEGTEHWLGPDEDSYTWENVPEKYVIEWWHNGLWQEADLESESYDVETHQAVDCETPNNDEPSQPSSGGSSTSTPSAPVCTDGNTIKLPANPHVLRTGDK